MSNDERYESRYLIQGTTGAEVIYNELIGRQAAAHMQLKSRTTAAPPGSPVELDAYLVPTGATGDWASFEGDIAIYMSGWKYMTVLPGMRMHVADTGMIVDFLSPVGTGHALTGHYTITPSTGPDTVTFDGALGVSAQVTLDADSQLLEPVNFVQGRIYTLWIVQPSSGGPYTLDYEIGTGWRASSDMVLTASADAVDMYTFVGGNANYETSELARNLNTNLI